jgi:hypothetical protein
MTRWTRWQRDSVKCCAMRLVSETGGIHWHPRRRMEESLPSSRSQVNGSTAPRSVLRWVIEPELVDCDQLLIGVRAFLRHPAEIKWLARRQKRRG